MPITPAQLHDPIIEYVQPAGLTLRPDDTIAIALERARQLPATQIILYCYVVDQEERLVGVVPIRRLLTTAPEARIDSIMIDDVEAIPSWATVLVAAEYFVNRRFLAFPVVEPGGRLVGVVDVSLFTDDVLTLARQSFDGIFQLIGVHATEGRTAWTQLPRSLPVAALQRRRRADVRRPRQLLRETARPPGRPRAVHPRRAHAGRGRQHPVADPDPAEPV